MTKPAGEIDLAFDTGLVVYLRNDIEDHELEVSIQEPFILQMAAEGILQMAAEGVCSLLFLASQILKEHSIEKWRNFTIVFLMRLLFKPSFLKQHQNNLDQYPLSPTSTAKTSTHQSLDSMIFLTVKYLLISVLLCQDSIFSLQGHGSSMRITFLKLFEKIVMSGLSRVKAM